MSLLEVEHLNYSYRLGERSVDVLRDLNFRVEEGEF
ncbi:MAG: bacitracin ABC transporter ATP-binding protein, partial [Bdellovibrionales bacterium]|nr:bacitracin ABC transporter ATP-binding protein [Bdellovibrionales bacterium]